MGRTAGRTYGWGGGCHRVAGDHLESPRLRGDLPRGQWGAPSVGVGHGVEPPASALAPRKFQLHLQDEVGCEAQARQGRVSDGVPFLAMQLLTRDPHREVGAAQLVLDALGIGG